MRKRVHPGRILKRHYIDFTNTTVLELAVKTDISHQTLSCITEECGSITPDIASKLSNTLNTSAQLWLNLQRNYDQC